MKLIKLIALTAFVIIGTFSAIFYTSCTKDACKGVTCLNKASCMGGQCVCKTGIGGSRCEIVYRDLYTANYAGVPHNAGHKDSTNVLKFNPTADTMNFRTMTLYWEDTGRLVTSFAITLDNITASGSTFTIDNPVTVGGFTYSGGGTISENVASLTLKVDTVGPQGSTYFHFDNFARQ